MTFSWNASSYDQLPLPHESWGRDLLDRAALQGDESVVELGAGTGRDTLSIARSLTTGHVTALDRSTTMLSRLRGKLPKELASKVSLRESDLNEPLPIPDQSCDLVFSVATLHWLRDHRPLAREVARVLKPGGRFLFECGGAGNIAHVRAALRSVLGTEYSEAHWNFPQPADERELLRRCGFQHVEAHLRESPTPPMDEATFRDYLQTVVLGPYTSEMNPTDLDAFISEIRRHLVRPVVDYVRLEVTASHPS
ncbi:MAG: class I SAM-dependent methyltransferase [Acidimicrobiales bacterium]